MEEGLLFWLTLYTNELPNRLMLVTFFAVFGSFKGTG